MKVQYNAPVVLTLSIISFAALLLTDFTGIPLTQYFFSIGPSINVSNPLEYLRLVTHIAGHGDWGHLLGNFTYILLLGPLLEEKYGSRQLLEMVLITAVITGLINLAFFSTGLMGASGIVFMMILLSSVSNLQRGRLPLTFLLVVVLFLGQEIINIFRNDHISQSAHIIGGICGAFFGFSRGTRSVEGQKRGW